MLRERLIVALVLAVVIATAAYYYVLRTKEPQVPPAPPEIHFRASAFLAPGAQAALPTTVRVKVWVSSSLLPITSAEIDPDGDRGTLATRALDVSQWKDAGVEGAGTNFYFDLPWEAPAVAQPVLTVHCAGNYVTVFYVNVATLQPWPEGGS